MSIEFLIKIHAPKAVSAEADSQRLTKSCDGIGRDEALAALAHAERAHPIGVAVLRARHLGDMIALRKLIAAYPPRAVLSMAGMLCEPERMLRLYKRHHPYGRREAKRARELELQGDHDNAARVRALIEMRCQRDTEGGRCPACSGTGELTKPKPHACPNCHSGYIASPELLTTAERQAEQELQHCYGDAVKEYHRYLDMAKAA
ncbi:uncharacterized phage protein [Aeromonas sp. RU39B]|uniref:hypothetical protein n=1 Tax=Aeromonas sp. RU39B TaxID=1907416 RepID=UPI000953CBB2|nr:hypothetical protein [Aeromonas sp. RU39B]SIR39585.1 uncharacterized phage protein [Aeromonas sp. RU39B]